MPGASIYETYSPMSSHYHPNHSPPHLTFALAMAFGGPDEGLVHRIGEVRTHAFPHSRAIPADN
jgi:hypothetical protein